MLLALLFAVQPALQQFVKYDATALVLEHVHVIDGSGSAPREDRALYISNGKLVAMEPPGAQHIDQKPAALDALSTDTSARPLSSHVAGPSPNAAAVIGKLAMAFECAFVQAGGTLMAGCDPTGNGATVSGFGDQRNVELLVEAGFRRRYFTLHPGNGVAFLGHQEHIGSIAPGKDADLVVVKGDPSKSVADIEKVEIVFKDGLRPAEARGLGTKVGRDSLRRRGVAQTGEAPDRRES